VIDVSGNAVISGWCLCILYRSSDISCNNHCRVMLSARVDTSVTLCVHAAQRYTSNFIQYY